jgi:PAS domain S-box-containing protein
VVVDADAADDDASGGNSPSMARLVAELETLRLLASSLAASRTIDEVANAIVNNLGATAGAVFGTLAIATPGHPDLALYQPDGLHQEVTDRWVSVPLDESNPLGTAVLTGESVHARDPAAVRTRFPGGADDAERMGLQAIAAYPVRMADGTVRAAIGLGWAQPTDEVDTDELAPAIALCGAALQRAWVSDESDRTAALLDTLLRQAPVGFAFVDHDLRFSHVNDRLAETNGLSAAEHLGRRLQDVVPELAEQLAPVLRRVLDHGESHTGVEITGETAARPGDTRVWEEGFYPVRTASGEVIGAGVVVVEVTRYREEQRLLRESVAQERAIARRLQAGLLPTSVPTFDGYDIHARYEAGTAGLRVGGDWYEVVELRPGDITVVIGDAVGHDLDAAIAMSQIRNALTGLSHGHDDPATVVEHLDEYATHTPEVFASTLFYGRLHPASGELRYTLAGHHPPLLMHADGTYDWFDAEPGPPIGVASARQTAVCELDVDDTLICYTDGLVEHHSEDIDVGRSRLIDVAMRHAAASADEMIDALLAEVPHAERPDDIAVLALRRTH